MKQVLAILFGAGFTVLVACCWGRLLLRMLPVRLAREEERPLSFLVGAPLLSLVVFALCAAQVARKGVFLGLGLAVLLAAWRRGALRASPDRLPPLPWSWRLLWLAVALPFGTWYFVYALAPEISPDGSTYHLGLVQRYLRAHGFPRITTDLYANLSQGVELLFLHAFAWGRHSAAALTHLAFLPALTWLMVCYGRRVGQPGMGVAGALLFFASPLVGIDAASAYIDIAVAAIGFTVFYLVQAWRERPTQAGLVPVGVVAGFAYAAKYTAFVAVPYALSVVLWHSWRRGDRRGALRGAFLAGVLALAMMSPWLAKNAVVVGNPFSPFLNRYFPNPYIHVSFEVGYREQMRRYEGLRSKADIPFEVTVRGGALQGLVGPMFLLLPLALLSLRHPEGRSLLLAGMVFALPYTANIGTRFLLPALPFLALALARTLVDWRGMAPLVIAAHAVYSWPTVLPTYCHEHAWRLERFPWAAALRQVPEEEYLRQHIGDYETARLVERVVPPGERIFSFTSLPEAYTFREVLSGYHAALNQRMEDMLFMPLDKDMQPTWRQSFRFAARPLRRLRVVQGAAHANSVWGVHELRLFHGDQELARDPDWRLRATPFPWDVGLAFDNDPVTRWRAWDEARAGQAITIDLARPQRVDRVQVDGAHDQWFLKLRVEGEVAPGRWEVLSASPTPEEVPPPGWLRRLATDEMKRLGVRYLHLHEGDALLPDLRREGSRWNVTLVGESPRAWVYRID